MHVSYTFVEAELMKGALQLQSSILTIVFAPKKARKLVFFYKLLYMPEVLMKLIN